GLPVISPGEAAERWGRSAAFVVTTYNAADRMKQLKALGCKGVVAYAYLFLRHPQYLLPHACLADPAGLLEQADDVQRAFNLFDTHADRAAFVAQVRWRLFFGFVE